jgi:hypothetical protein
VKILRGYREHFFLAAFASLSCMTLWFLYFSFSGYTPSIAAEDIMHAEQRLCGQHTLKGENILYPSIKVIRAEFGDLKSCS